MRRVLLLAVFGTVVSSLPGLAEGAPKVTLSPRVIKEGQTVTVSAAGFTPNGHVLAHLARPDGSEYPEMQFIADARGNVSHVIRIILIQIGTYELQMVDLTSKAVGSSRFMVVEGTPPAPGTPKSDRTPPWSSGTWQGSISGKGKPPAQMVLVSLSGGEIGGVVGTRGVSSTHVRRRALAARCDGGFRGARRANHLRRRALPDPRHRHGEAVGRRVAGVPAPRGRAARGGADGGNVAEAPVEADL